MSEKDDHIRLLLDWTRKVHGLEYAHRYESIRKGSLNLWLGVPSVIVSALISTQASTPWANSKVTLVLLAIGGTMIAILVGLQTFLKPAEIAEKHRSSSNAYEGFRHRLELLLAQKIPAGSSLLEEMGQIKAEWERMEAPNVSASSWDRAKARVAEIGTYPVALRFAVATSLAGTPSLDSEGRRAL